MPHKRLENGFLADVMFITKLSESEIFFSSGKTVSVKRFIYRCFKSEVAFHA